MRKFRAQWNARGVCGNLGVPIVVLTGCGLTGGAGVAKALRVRNAKDASGIGSLAVSAIHHL